MWERNKVHFWHHWFLSFLSFFTHCNIHDPECNIHDSVLSSSKGGTHHKRNIYHFGMVVSLFTYKTIISFVFSYACRIHTNLMFNICTWERGFFGCNIHDSSIYLNINFCIIVNLKQNSCLLLCICSNGFPLTTLMQM